MADHSLAHRAQHQTPTETVHLPPSTPPTNHGKTVAAWTTTWTIVLGALVAALGVAFALVWLFWVGMGVIVLGIVLGKVLQVLGHGQGGAATLAREKRRGGH
ncbi:HGxxPAAW family protein [Cellulomonas sp. NPDC057328]|uniref:HGxxPAAW family protein n=1 Tax=Cellulomonas sp. NPDC057328 TaxID=3346101 RepID=UPI0036358457